MNLPCDQCPVRATAACAVLTPEQREALSRGGRPRKLKSGEMLHAACDDSTQCANLAAGALTERCVVE